VGCTRAGQAVNRLVQLPYTARWVLLLGCCGVAVTVCGTVLGALGGSTVIGSVAGGICALGTYLGGVAVGLNFAVRRARSRREAGSHDHD